MTTMTILNLQNCRYVPSRLWLLTSNNVDLSQMNTGYADTFDIFVPLMDGKLTLPLIR